MVQLQESKEEIEAAGITLVAISYDSVDALKKFADEKEIGYLLLSDEGSKTIDAYGIRNEEARARTFTDGIPYPGTFVLDKEGTVKAKLFLEGYRLRHQIEQLIEAAKEIQ